MSTAINERYSALAEKKTCLSCGGAFARAQVRPGEVLVDLGSGRGNDVMKACAQGASFAYGVDISDGMLAKARESAADAGVHNAIFLKGELESLPIGDAHADVVISNCTINHARDKYTVWSEIWRILKPGGRFIVSDIYATETVPERYRNDPKAVAECWAGAVTRADYLDTLARVGFSGVKLLEESEPYAKGAVSVASITVTGRKPSA